MDAVDSGGEACKGKVENNMDVDTGIVGTRGCVAAEEDEADAELGPAAARAERNVDMLQPTREKDVEARNDTKSCRHLHVPDVDKNCFSDKNPNPLPNKRTEEKPSFEDGAKRARVDIGQTE